MVQCSEVDFRKRRSAVVQCRETPFFEPFVLR
jgi:hypothetical protein